MGKKKSNRGKGSFAVYKSETRSVKNKVRAIARHVKQNPNDEMAKAALKAAPNSKSARFGYKSEGTKVEGRMTRLDAMLAKQVRKADNVLKTVKDKNALVLGSRLCSATVLKQEFNFPRPAKKI